MQRNHYSEGSIGELCCTRMPERPDSWILYTMRTVLVFPGIVPSRCQAVSQPVSTYPRRHLRSPVNQLVSCLVLFSLPVVDLSIFSCAPTPSSHSSRTSSRVTLICLVRWAGSMRPGSLGPSSFRLVFFSEIRIVPPSLIYVSTGRSSR